MDALVVNIMRLAASCASDINAVLPHDHTNKPPHLTSACRALDLLEHSAALLRAALPTAGTVSETLAASMTERVGACGAQAAALFKQVARLDEESAARTSEDFWAVLEEFVEVHVRLLRCYADLLSLPTPGQQEERLAGPASQGLLQQAAHIVSLAADAPDIFALEETEAYDALPYSGKVGDAPPPYEPGPAAPPPPTATAESSSSASRRRAWAKITSPVKAMRGHMGNGTVLPLVDDLCAAATTGQAAHVEGLLACGAAVDGLSSAHDTALGLAAESNHIHIALLLLQAGAQASFHSPHRMPPLFVAAANGHKDLALLLLAHGASVTATDIRGQPFLIRLVEEGNHEAMRFLLAHGADANARDTTTGRAPLAHAVATNDVAMAAVLLAFGADPNARGAGGRPVLARAVDSQNAALVRLLLDAGADPNGRDGTGASVLAVACRRHVKTSDTVALLLRCRARVDSTTEAGVTVLAEALARHRTGLARILLEHGADAGGEDKATGQPLVVVVVRSRKIVLEDKVTLLEMMLRGGASARARDVVTGETAVEVARKVESKKVVRLLEANERKESCALDVSVG